MRKSMIVLLPLLIGAVAFWLNETVRGCTPDIDDVQKALRGKDVAKLRDYLASETYVLHAPAMKGLVEVADANTVREVLTGALTTFAEPAVIDAAFQAWPQNPVVIELAWEITAKPATGENWVHCVQQALVRDSAKTVEFMKGHSRDLVERYGAENADKLQALLTALAKAKVPAEALRIEPVCPGGAELRREVLSSGNVRAECRAALDGGGSQRAGPLVTWHPNGLRMMQVAFVNGVPSGNAVMWDESGRKSGEGPFNEKFEQVGTWTEWNEQTSHLGVVEKNGRFVNGVREGDWTITTGAGQTEKGRYLHGKEDGAWVLMDASGTVLAETMFKNGVKKKVIGHTGKSTRTCTYDAKENESCTDNVSDDDLSCNEVLHKYNARMQECISRSCAGLQGDRYANCMDNCAGKVSARYAECYGQLVTE